MARASTTSDAFNALAEPRRRAIIDLLAAGGGMAVGAIVAALALPQPTVSKHLGVLRAVGVVGVERVGQTRVYRLRPEELRPMYDWLKRYERLWDHQLARIKERAERTERERQSNPDPRKA